MALKLDDYFEESAEAQEERRENDNDEEEEQRRNEERKKKEHDDFDDDYITPPSRRRRRLMVKIAVGTVAVIAIIIAVRVMFFAPKVSEALVRGYVVKLERQDAFFNSYEGVFVVDTPDSTRSFEFSITDQELGKYIYHAMQTDSILVCKYRTYNRALPWRGKTPCVFEEAKTIAPTPVSAKKPKKFE